MVRVVILPGNGNCDVNECCWYPWLQRKLRAHDKVTEVLLHNMPEPFKATRSVWLAYMRDTLLCDSSTVVVGHSSGAVAAMRYAETRPLAGVFLVGAYTSHLDCPVERASGYFDGPWLWRDMKRNVPPAGVQRSNDDEVGGGGGEGGKGGLVSAGWYQYASDTDPFLPVQEQAQVARELDAKIRWDAEGGHYNDCDTLPALLKDITSYLDTL